MHNNFFVEPFFGGPIFGGLIFGSFRFKEGFEQKPFLKSRPQDGGLPACPGITYTYYRHGRRDPTWPAGPHMASVPSLPLFQICYFSFVYYIFVFYLYEYVIIDWPQGLLSPSCRVVMPKVASAINRLASICAYLFGAKRKENCRGQ